MLSTLVASEEPEPRCLRCHANKRFHDDNPHGVRYLVPEDISWTFVESDDDMIPSSTCVKTYVCYNYIDMMLPDDMT